MILRGRAACCQTKIDFRYPCVELLTGCLFAALWNFYGDHPLLAVVYGLFVSGLIVSSLIDLDHFIIPDRFTLGGVVVGVICSAIDPELQGPHQTVVGAFGWSIAGALIGGLVLLAIGNLGTLLFKKEAMGFGDVKFAAAMCAFLGAESITFILPISAMCGAVLGMLIIFFSRGSWGTRIPYGPFLAIGATAWLFGGEAATRGYWLNLITRIAELTGYHFN
jgi:leader peptidase (prepilin peptidase)/N-methyltransferase